MKNCFVHCLPFFLLTGMWVYAAYGEVYTTDVNRDGKPDGWTHVNQGKVEIQEIDMNFDGKIDSVYLYEMDGTIREEILDTNYDGKMDNWRLYKDGELVMDRIDSDQDGRVDMWVHVDRGRIYKVEKDTNGNGKPDYARDY